MTHTERHMHAGHGVDIPLVNILYIISSLASWQAIFGAADPIIKGVAGLVAIGYGVWRWAVEAKRERALKNKTRRK